MAAVSTPFNSSLNKPFLSLYSSISHLGFSQVVQFPTLKPKFLLSNPKTVVISATKADANEDDSLTTFDSSIRQKTRRHTIQVFVGDESGMINRIAGVCSKRVQH